MPYRRVAAGSYEALGRPNPSAALQEAPADVIAEVLQRLSECGLTARVCAAPAVASLPPSCDERDA